MKRDSFLSLCVVRHLSAADGHGDLVEHSVPDAPENARGAPPGTKFVDLFATSQDGTSFAVEHTKIESYTGQLTDAEQIEKILLPLAGALNGQLPLDRRFELAVGMGAVGDKTLDPDVVRAALKPWIVEQARSLPAGSPTVSPKHLVTAGPPDLPVLVTLYAWPSTARGGQLAVLQSRDRSDDEMDALRVGRLRKALATKLPKLNEHQNCRSVLVLEDPDMSMSNMSDVWVGLQAAAVGMVLCDTVVVIESWLDPPSAVVVYDSGVWLEDFAAHRFCLPSDELT